MKPVIVLLFASAALSAAEDPALTTAALDAGGGLTSGDEVEITGSLGGFGSISDDGGGTTARAGFTGQLYDPAHLDVTPGTATLVQGTPLTFTAEIVCDDDSTLPADNTAWSVDSSLLLVSGTGEVTTTGLLPQSLFATLTAAAAGVTGSAALTVRDGNGDDFDSYAGDGMPDAWQLQHFGLQNPDAAPAADPDHDGQSNQTEYLAGTDPNDASLFLQLTFAAGTPPPGVRILQFSPFLPDRTYTLESSATLTDPWASLPGTPFAASTPDEGLLTDASASASRIFYRLRITVP